MCVGSKFVDPLIERDLVNGGGGDRLINSHCGSFALHSPPLIRLYTGS